MELHTDELFFQFHPVHLMAATAKMTEYIISPNVSYWHMARTKVKCLYHNNNQTFLYQFD